MTKREAAMRDPHYDLISVLYHALEDDETLARYIKDAEDRDDPDLAEHYRDIQEKYREIARQTKEVLKEKLVADELVEEKNEED